jgi:hypothetical protein
MGATPGAILGMLCADPELAAAFFDSINNHAPGSESEPIARFIKAMVLAHQALGTREGRTQGQQWLTNEQLDYLEAALVEIRDIEASAPGLFAALAARGAEPCRAKVNAVVAGIERQRPGRVRELLGEIVQFKYELIIADLPVEDKLASLFNLCEADPDGALELLDSLGLDLPPLRFAKALCYGAKGLVQVRANPHMDVTTLSDADLDYLELALREIREIETEFLEVMDEWAKVRVKAMVGLVEINRPGRAKGLLGEKYDCL